MMEAASTSKTSVNFYHGAPSQKTVIFKEFLWLRDYQFLKKDSAAYKKAPY
jgi:hypothetical protein